MPNEEEDKKPQQPQEQPRIQPLHERSSWEELGKTVNREEIIRKWDVIDTSSTSIITKGLDNDILGARTSSEEGEK